MKKKNAFTLIELLAVIVILAIIAVIATPIILGVIDDSRLKGKENSINGLLDSVKMAYTTSQLTTTPLSLTLTSSISSSGVITITDKNGVTKEVEYSGEKPISGSIKMDMDGNLSAISIKYNDGYTCSMGVGEHGCSKSRFTSTDSFFVSDPNELERMIYIGGSPRNYIMLDEMVNWTPTPVEYRIVAVELDGSIKVMRNEVLKNGNSNLIMPYDSNNTGNNQGTTGPRLNSENPYCNYAGIYYGCNAWSKMTGTINDVPNTLVSTDSEIKTYLNTTFYETLAESTKDAIVTHSFNLVGSGYNGITGKGRSETDLYNYGKTANTWVGRIGLIELRDWFNAAETCNPGLGGGYYLNNNSDRSTYICSYSNYMYIDVPHWWTITPNSSVHSDMFSIYDSGLVNTDRVYHSFAIRPVFFLSSNTQLTGDGTKGANAYKIKS